MTASSLESPLIGGEQKFATWRIPAIRAHPHRLLGMQRGTHQCYASHSPQKVTPVEVSDNKVSKRLQREKCRNGSPLTRCKVSKFPTFRPSDWRAAENIVSKPIVTIDDSHVPARRHDHVHPSCMLASWHGRQRQEIASVLLSWSHGAQQPVWSPRRRFCARSSQRPHHRRKADRSTLRFSVFRQLGH